MKRSFKLSGLMCVLVAGSPAASLFAHGGSYPGPQDTVPPNLGGHGDTTAPGNPGGPTSPTSPTGHATGGRGPATGGKGGAPGQPGIGPRGGGGGMTRRANG